MYFFLSKLIFNVLSGWEPLKNFLSSILWHSFLEWLSRQRGFGRAQAGVGLGRMRMTMNGGTQCTLENTFVFLTWFINRVYKQGVQIKLASRQEKRNFSIF